MKNKNQDTKRTMKQDKSMHESKTGSKSTEKKSMDAKHGKSGSKEW